MIKKDLCSLSVVTGMKERYGFEKIKEFIDNRDSHAKRVLILYGFDHTGKTTLAKQALAFYKDSKECIVYEVQETDTMRDIYDILEELRNGEEVSRIVWFQEITRAKDFIGDSACVADIFATDKTIILLTGSDSLSFDLASRRELFARVRLIHTNYISYVEHCHLFGRTGIGDYIRCGGLVDKQVVHDYDSAVHYVDKNIAENIFYSVNNVEKHGRFEEIKDLSFFDLRVIIREIISLCSSVFAKEKIQDMLKVSAADDNHPIQDILELIEDGFFTSLNYVDLRKVTNEFYNAVRVVAGNRLYFSDWVPVLLNEILLDLDVLSFTTQLNFIYEEGRWGKWRRISETHPYHVIQPAIKYYFLQEGRKFIEGYKYYNWLAVEQKRIISKKLDTKIEHDMVTSVVLFDVQRILNNIDSKNRFYGKRFKVCKTVFRDDGKFYAGHDLLVHDMDSSAYWVFLVHNGSEPFCGLENNIYGQDISDALNYRFGKMGGSAVLYNGISHESSSGIIYLNILEFLSILERCQDMDQAYSELIKALHTDNRDS